MGKKKVNPYAEWAQKREELDRMPRGLTLANTGSTCGCFAFDYRYWSASGMNLGTAPQPLYYDFEMLKKYGDHLAKGATVFLVVEEFKLLVDHYADLSREYKYYFLLDPEQIIGYSKKTDATLKRCPARLTKGNGGGSLKRLIKRALRKALRRSAPKSPAKEAPAKEAPQKLSPEANDALWANRFVEGWYHEFGWEADDSHLSDALKEIVSINQKRLNDMIEYCTSHGWTPVVTVPPMSESIVKRLPEGILEECLWEPLRAVRAAGCRVLDLYHDERFQSYALYENALAMNDAGRALFNREAQEFISQAGGFEA